MKTQLCEGETEERKRRKEKNSEKIEKERDEPNDITGMKKFEKKMRNHIGRYEINQRWKYSRRKKKKKVHGDTTYSTRFFLRIAIIV